MDRSHVLVGALASVAALGLLAVGATYSAPEQTVEIGHNEIRAGGIQLDLTAGGHADASLSFADLLPGASSEQLFWLARNDTASSVPGALTVTFDRLRDIAGPCSVSLDKARAEAASGITGCAVNGDTARGAPAQGNLSRLLTVQVRYAPTTDSAGGCAGAGATEALLPAGGPGNLRRATSADAGRGVTLQLRRADGKDLVLRPGAGACLLVRAVWTPNSTAPAAATPAHPLDNAAQGDSLLLRARFGLTQVPS